MAKGKQVYIEGRLQTRSWDDKEGNKRYTTEVICLRMQFLGGRAQEGPKEAQDMPAEAPPVNDIASEDDDLPF